MNKKIHSKTSLFLMEIIIAIMFFSLASAVCLRLFVSAYDLSSRDQNLDEALIWSQNFSESFSGCKGRLLMIKALYPAAYLKQKDEETEGTIIIFFDNDWEIVDNAIHNAAYEAILEIKKDSAANVYSDVNNYGVSLIGDALVGKIAVLDVRQKTEGFEEIPDDPSYIIFSNQVDYYIGE